MLIISGELDHTVPRAISDAAYKKQLRNEGVTEFVELAVALRPRGREDLAGHRLSSSGKASRTSSSM